MNKLTFLFLLSPLLAASQNPVSRFENDTVFTASGYKVYKDQVLQMANGTSEAGYFNFVKFHSTMNRNDTYILQSSTVRVNKIRSFKASGPGSFSARLFGMASLKDGKQMEVDLLIDLDKAIGNQPYEIAVPAEFRNKVATSAPVAIQKQETKQETPGDIRKILIADELKKLFDLYKQGALSKEEYEVQKKKLLARE